MASIDSLLTGFTLVIMPVCMVEAEVEEEEKDEEVGDEEATEGF